MKLRNKILTAITASLISGTALASTQIDYRHEYKFESEQQTSRVKLGHGFKISDDWKGNVGLEMKFASNDKTEFLTNVNLTETELDLGLTYKLNKWQFKPGMPIAMTSKKTTFKPQVRVVYKSDFGLTTGLRYRLELVNYIDGESDEDMDTGEEFNRPTKSKVTLTGSYKIKSVPNLKLSYETNYVKSHNNVRQYNYTDSNYDFGLIVGYQLGSWRPFAELWDVSQGSKLEERQLKARVGIKYKF